MKVVTRRDHRYDGTCWCHAVTEDGVEIHGDEVGAALDLHPKLLAEQPWPEIETP